MSKRRYRLVESHYKRLPGDWSNCVYCGDIADTADHVPPMKRVWAHGVDYYTQQGFDIVKAPCCRECNSVLGDRDLPTIEERAIHMYAAIQKRYKPILACPEWDIEELDELDYSLRAHIEDQACLRLWVERRLQFIESVYQV